MTLSVKCAPLLRPYIAWDVHITIEILCNFETSSSCAPHLLPTQAPQDSLIKVCTDNPNPTFDLDLMAYASDLGLSQKDSITNDYLKWRLFTAEFDSGVYSYASSWYNGWNI